MFKRIWLHIIFSIALLGSVSNIFADANSYEKVEYRNGAGKNIKPHLNPVNTAEKTSTAAYKSLNVKDSNHFFTNIVDNYASYASKFKIKGGDGINRTLYQIEGSLKNKKGIFEWIVHNGKIVT